VSGEYPGRVQRYAPGSCVVVAADPRLRQESFTVSAFVYPTTPVKGVQGLVTRWSGTCGWGLFLGDDSSLELWLGDDSGKVSSIRGGAPLHSHSWFAVVGS